MSVSWTRSYIKLTEFLGQILGPDYEVVLHDICDKDCSVIAIANGHISGRTIGAPLTSLALQAIANHSHETSDYRSNHTGISGGGKLLRSSMFYIKDSDEKLVGLLCINFDDSRYRDISDNILKLCHPDAFINTNFVSSEQNSHTKTLPVNEHESFQNSLSELTDDILSQALKKRQVAADRLSKKERQGLIEELNKKGFFLLKGAIKQVADQMQCSQTTVYRYLDKVAKENGVDGE